MNELEGRKERVVRREIGDGCLKGCERLVAGVEEDSGGEREWVEVCAAGNNNENDLTEFVE